MDVKCVNYRRLYVEALVWWYTASTYGRLGNNALSTSRTDPSQALNGARNAYNISSFEQHEIVIRPNVQPCHMTHIDSTIMWQIVKMVIYDAGQDGQNRQDTEVSFKVIVNW